MKARNLFLILGISSLLLIGVAAGLTYVLFRLSVPPSTPSKAELAIQEERSPKKVLSETLTASKTGKYAGESEEDSLDQNVESKDAARRRLIQQKMTGSVGSVIAARGDIFAAGRMQRERRLMVNTKVNIGDSIETGAGARVRIMLEDGTIISIGENTKITLDEYLFLPENPPDCAFLLRVIKGVCRVIAGKIVDLNPQNFMLRMGLTTVGIRGCDVAVESTFDRDDIYVIQLSPGKEVVVTASRDGSQVMQMESGQSVLDRSKETQIHMDQPRTQVSVIRGTGPGEVLKGDQEQFNKIMWKTSQLPPANYEIRQSRTGSILTVLPSEKRLDESTKETP